MGRPFKKRSKSRKTTDTQPANEPKVFINSKKLDRQSWLARLLFQGGQVGIRVAAEAGAQGPGLPPAVETLAEFGPSLAADPTQLAHGGWAQPRRRGRDQAHLPSEHGGRGGRLA